VDELHSRCLKAQKEIGALMEYMMRKHGGDEGVCEQMDAKRTVRPQLSLLRQLVDTLVMGGDVQGDGVDDEAADSEDDMADDADDAARAIRRQRSKRRNSIEMITGAQSFANMKVGVKMKLRESKKTSSYDVKYGQAAQKTGKGETGLSAEALGLPGEGRIRDVLGELELQSPALKYAIVCDSIQMYTLCVTGFLRDIGADVDYEAYAVSSSPVPISTERAQRYIRS
jgi:hypothetical protein